MSETRVVNRHHEDFDVYIGRGTPWGNPYVIPPYSRQRSLEEYEKYMRMTLKFAPLLREELLSLRGKRLGCSCKPRACHGDILVKLIEELSS